MFKRSLNIHGWRVKPKRLESFGLWLNFFFEPAAVSSKPVNEFCQFRNVAQHIQEKGVQVTPDILMGDLVAKFTDNHQRFGIFEDAELLGQVCGIHLGLGIFLQQSEDGGLAVTKGCHRLNAFVCGYFSPATMRS